jgi:amino acid transporter
LVLYGVGDMLGPGIYALIGKAAGVMGNAVWLAFAASMVAALLTGLSYASLGSRYPRAAGAAYVTQRAFGMPLLSYLVGLAVMASGLTSMGTQSRAFAGYFTGLVANIPAPVIIINAALIALKRRFNEPRGAFEVPVFVPAGGIIVCAALLTRAQPKSLGIAAALLAGIVVLYFVSGAKRGTTADPSC